MGTVHRGHLCPFPSNTIKLIKAAAWDWGAVGAWGALEISFFQPIKDGASVLAPPRLEGRGLSQKRSLLATISSQLLNKIPTAPGA